MVRGRRRDAQGDADRRAEPVVLRLVSDLKLSAFGCISLLVDGQRVYLWSGEIHPVSAPQPRPVARRAREDEGERLQRRLDLRRLGVSLAEAGRLRLLRRSRHGPLPRHRRRGRDLRDRPAGAVHQRRGRRRRLPRLADHQARTARTNNATYLSYTGRVPVAHRPDHRAPPAHERLGDGDPLPDRERVREQRHEPDGHPVHEAPVRRRCRCSACSARRARRCQRRRTLSRVDLPEPFRDTTTTSPPTSPARGSCSRPAAGA